MKLDPTFSFDWLSITPGKSYSLETFTWKPLVSNEERLLLDKMLSEWKIMRDQVVFVFTENGPAEFSQGWDSWKHELQDPVTAEMCIGMISTISTLHKALTRIAAFDDTGAEERLKTHNSYSAFDEPSSVRIARETLKELNLGPHKEVKP